MYGGEAAARVQEEVALGVRGATDCATGAEGEGEGQRQRSRSKKGKKKGAGQAREGEACPPLCAMASADASAALDEKARRVRALLSSYYGAEESEGDAGSGSVVVDTTSLDKATFDADRSAPTAATAWWRC